MVNNVGVTEKTLNTTIGTETSDILNEDITIISGELGLGFLLFDSAGTIGVITNFVDTTNFTVTTHATSYTIQVAVTANATATDLASGKTAYVKSGKITGTLRDLPSGQQWPAMYSKATKSSNSIKIFAKPTADIIYRKGANVTVDLSNTNLVAAINQRYSSVNT